MTEPAREADVQRDVVKYLIGKGYRVLRLNAGGYRNRVQLLPPGTPDLVAIGDNGRTIWIEVKGPHGKLSEDQKEWHAVEGGRGHEVITVHSLNELKLYIENGTL